MKKYIILAAFLAVTGCASVPEQKLAPINTPANLTVRCPDIPHIDSPANLGTALTYITNLQSQYTECAGRSDSLHEVTNTNNARKDSTKN